MNKLLRRAGLASAQLAIALVCFFAAGCTPSARYDQATCILLDISGSYSNEVSKGVEMVRTGILALKRPGDTLIVSQISASSFNDDNIVAQMRFDRRPSQANAEKLLVMRQLKEYAESKPQALSTDIAGGMMLCADRLKASGAGRQNILIFSDMSQDLPRGMRREFSANEFADIHIAAINVKKLGADSANPKVFRDRLAAWERTVQKHGAPSWQLILDAAVLPDYLLSLR